MFNIKNKLMRKLSCLWCHWKRRSLFDQVWIFIVTFFLL